MPTQPVLEIIDREGAKKAAEAAVQKGTRLLTELVNFGSGVFARISRPARKKWEEEVDQTRLAPCMAYYQLLEMTEAVRVLVAEGQAVPARLPLRTAFEVLLDLEYLASGSLKQKSYAYLACDALYRLKVYDQLDPKTERGKQFVASMAKDEAGKTLPILTPPDLAERRANLVALLKQPEFSTAHAAYNAARARTRGHKRRIEWYSLYAGPKNLAELAEITGHPAMYEILYRQWSGTAHAKDMYRILHSGRDGGGAVWTIPDPRELPQIVSFATAFMVNGSRAILGLFRPSELKGFSRWFAREVHPFYRLFAGDPGGPPVTRPSKYRSPFIVLP